MTKKELELKEERIDSQITYMKSIISSTHHPEDSKQSAKETLKNLQKEKEVIIQQIIAAGKNEG